MSGAGSRAKGRRFQSAMRDFFREKVSVVEPGGAGVSDTDLLLLTDPLVSVEVKNCKTMDLSGSLDQAVRQAPAGAIPVVAHKRRGRGSAGEAYVVLRAEDFRRLLR